MLGKVDSDVSSVWADASENAYRVVIDVAKVVLGAQHHGLQAHPITNLKEKIKKTLF